MTTPENKLIEKNGRKVNLMTVDGRVVWGYVLLEDGERLSDLMNDDRKFIPVHILMPGPVNSDDVYKMRIFNKDFINYIEDK